jgi:Uma2 family endonuclease
MSRIAPARMGKKSGNGPPPSVPRLEVGDHLDQRTFHERYEAMPDDARFELIGGIVYMPSPIQWPHGKMHKEVIEWLSAYEKETPGVEYFLNVTNILGPESEPEPDAGLVIVPEKGGQVRETKERYLEGAPELIVEIASSTESIDLHGKKRDYEEAGVREYVVVAIRQSRVYWFVLRRGKYVELSVGRDGILRSEVFPGLWLDADALLARDRKSVHAALQQGVASREHASFVAKLARR